MLENIGKREKYLKNIKHTSFTRNTRSITRSTRNGEGKKTTRKGTLEI